MRWHQLSTFLVAMFALLLSLAIVAVAADERLAGIACRSVHLQYQAPESDSFTNTVVVETSAPGTYFCAAGFSKGYFGLQELANGHKLVIFSVWDPGRQDDPGTVDEARRVKLLHHAEGVRIGRFGNEGTGGQSFFDYEWEPGKPYKFRVRARVVGERTEYAADFLAPEFEDWKHLVTFSTIAGGKRLEGLYAFVEDFRRNRESTKHTRRARFQDAAVSIGDGEWKPVDRARFTADSNPAKNINAGVREGGFYLATGGEISNNDTPLGSMLSVP